MKQHSSENVLAKLKVLDQIEQVIAHRTQNPSQAERALDMLNSILESMGDGVFVVDEKGDMLFCNRASEHILGYGLLNMPFEERVKLIGNYLPDMVTPFPPNDLPIARAIRGENTDQIDIFIRNSRKPDGVWISVSGRPMRNQNGEITGGIVVLRDITQQKKARLERERFEEQMFRGQKLESLGILAGGIAHDFNNLLMGVLGNADLALKETTVSSTTHERISQISIAARRLADLTNQLLAYSGRGTVVEGKLCLSQLVEEMIHLLRPIVTKKADVRFQFDFQLPAIHADATQLRQVVMNLITNASDALGENSGVISVRTGVIEACRDYLANTYVDDQLPEGRYVVLEVSDTGCGMTEETIAKIFDPFFSTKFTGRGLGLAAVLGIVRRHSGALNVRSTVGAGTTFEVLFPVADIGESFNINTVQNSSKWKGKGTVLVVDDEETVRTVAKEMLEHYGFEVTLAGSGAEAIRMVREFGNQIDTMLLDLTMPDMNGDEVLLKLRDFSAKPRVVLSSGYHEMDTNNRLKNTQISAFLQKPYTTEVLINTLKKVMENA